MSTPLLRRCTALLLLLGGACAGMVQAAPATPAANTLPTPAECGLDDDEPPYPGATATGYKGALESDPVWHRNVRSRRGRDGQMQYRLHWQRTWYASIEPVRLRGQAWAYRVRQHGCHRLLDPRGRAYPLPPFRALSYPSLTPSPLSGLLRFETGRIGQAVYHYARFDRRGRLTAVSPHTYSMSYSSSSLPTDGLSPPLLDVVIPAPDRHGILNLTTLREVIEPRWLGVGGIRLNGPDREPRYLLTDDGQTRTVYSREGQVLLRDIHGITLLPHGLPPRPNAPASDQAAMVITRQGGAQCEVYDLDLKPLLSQPHRTRHGSCLTAPDQTGGLGLAGETPDGILHFYTRQPDGTLRQTGQVNGSLAALTRTGNAVTRIDTPAGPRYRVYTFAAQPTHPQDFDDFRDLGCGFHEVRLGEQWLTLLPDGSTRTERYFPFSC